MAKRRGTVSGASWVALSILRKTGKESKESEKLGRVFETITKFQLRNFVLVISPP